MTQKLQKSPLFATKLEKTVETHSKSITCEDRIDELLVANLLKFLSQPKTGLA